MTTYHIMASIHVFALTPHTTVALQLTPESLAIGLESLFALGHDMHMLDYL
jgi:hypothetical protein